MNFSLLKLLAHGFFTPHSSLNNTLNTFGIKPYTKKKFALLYFLFIDPHVAVNRLMIWIKLAHVKASDCPPASAQIFESARANIRNAPREYSKAPKRISEMLHTTIRKPPSE